MQFLLLAMRVNFLILLTLPIISNANNVDQQFNPEQRIVELNSKGFKDYEYNVANDRYYFDLGYMVNADPMTSANVAGFRGQFTYISNPLAWTLYGSQSTVLAQEALGDNSLDPNKNLTITEFGIGVSRRSSLIRDFITSEKFYDELMAIVTYSSAEGEILTNPLSGYGLVSGYGIFYRTSHRIHWGVRFEYHLHSLEDETIENAPVELTASWFTTTFSLGVNF